VINAVNLLQFDRRLPRGWLRSQNRDPAALLYSLPPRPPPARRVRTQRGLARVLADNLRHVIVIPLRSRAPVSQRDIRSVVRRSRVREDAIEAYRGVSHRHTRSRSDRCAAGTEALGAEGAYSTTDYA